MVKASIVGFDPASFRNLGWASVELSAEGDDQDCELGFRSGTYVSTADEFGPDCLWEMLCFIDSLLDECRPDAVLIEKTSSFVDRANPFITGQVSGCIGVILAACGKGRIPVKYVYPRHVKKVLTGQGKATKSQMKKAVSRIIAGDEKSLKLDSEHAYDALGNVLSYLADVQLITLGGEPK